MKEKIEVRVGSIHLPTIHRLRYFEVSHVSEPKRETQSDLCCTGLNGPFVSIQLEINRCVYLFIKNFHF